MAQKMKPFDVSFKLKAIESGKNGTKKQLLKVIALVCSTCPLLPSALTMSSSSLAMLSITSSINSAIVQVVYKRGSHLKPGLVLKPGLQSP